MRLVLLPNSNTASNEAYKWRYATPGTQGRNNTSPNTTNHV